MAIRQSRASLVYSLIIIDSRAKLVPHLGLGGL